MTSYSRQTNRFQRPLVNTRRKYYVDPLDAGWWCKDKPIGDVMDVGTRVTNARKWKGTVESAPHESYRVVRWDNTRNGDVGVREYVRLDALREMEQQQ